MVFVRPASTAPYGFQFAPGSLVATLDHYEALTVHEVSHLEQDWWLPSRVLTGVEWVDPLDVSFRFGGAPRVELADTTAGEGGPGTVGWPGNRRPRRPGAGGGRPLPPPRRPQGRRAPRRLSARVLGRPRCRARRARSTL